MPSSNYCHWTSLSHIVWHKQNLKQGPWHVKSVEFTKHLDAKLKCVQDFWWLISVGQIWNLYWKLLNKLNSWLPCCPSVRSQNPKCHGNKFGRAADALKVFVRSHSSNPYDAFFKHNQAVPAHSTTRFKILTLKGARAFVGNVSRLAGKDPGFEFGGRGRTRFLVSINWWDFENLYKMDRFLEILALTKNTGS